MSLVEFSLLASSSLFVIMDPIALVPAFLAMTAHDSSAQRIRMARLASMVAAGVLLVFALAGQSLFKILGLSISAFKIAGGILLFTVALDMLRAQVSPVRETKEETMAGAAKEDIAITPLGVPMLAGPGAISTVILLHSQAKGWAQEVSLLLCVAVVSLACYLTLRFASVGAGWINPIAMKITTRIMGLLLAAIAVQFVLDGLAEQKGRIF